MLNHDNTQDRNQKAATDASSQNSTAASSTSLPSLSLPKGGGAIRGIGEKFGANPVTGTGSMTVPIATSAGRSGFGPQLSLSYDSGAGNGPFGLGWNLSLPAITRKTDKGLPQYQDAQNSDVFILSGAEDLVPVLKQDALGTWTYEELPPRTVNGTTYRIRRYRPRVEGLFAHIERWTNPARPEDSFWRSISKDNITTWYGRSDNSRIADPAHPERIFSWLICETYDDKGNILTYHYKAEDAENIDLSQAHQHNRGDKLDPRRTANRYLKDIRYGNHIPYLPKLEADQPWPEPPGDGNWYFEVVFDYGEHDQANPTPQEAGKWTSRPDPFSSYRSTFEVRTQRLCQRVLMFHHVPDDPQGPQKGYDGLVRSTDFTYEYEQDAATPRKPIFSKLIEVTQLGYQRQAGGDYLSASLPPVEFTYSDATIQTELRELHSDSLANLPIGIGGAHYQWVDLDGEGLSGVLTEQAGAWFYKRNLSPTNVVGSDGGAHIEAKFAPLELVSSKPAMALANRAQFLDLAGDGRPDVVQFAGPTPGFYERTMDEQWDPFVPFVSLPNVDWSDPNLKFIDLDGDGHADILISEHDAFMWHRSLGEDGFEAAQRTSKPWDEEQGPSIVFADGEQSISLADMSGDGLSDIVRIRNSEVCYWPNLGYGRFGAKVTMDNAPLFDYVDQFDHRRIRLADIDGTGTTDLLYLHGEGVRVYFNQAGNSWSAATTITIFPALDNVADVQALDLLGNGTACLVWSSPLPGEAGRPLRYIDLMGGQKPHLLTGVINNLGAETRIQYTPSTRFYVADKLAGTPWLTRIPFPVHVVEQVQTYDYVSRNLFATRYAYHHGFYDGVEREFRGFGRVDQWDTEALATLTDSGAFPQPTNVDATSQVPPVWTKTWFHTGAYFGEARVSKHFEQEYYREGDLSDALAGLTDPQLEAMLLDDTVLPATILLSDGTRLPYSLSDEEAREASRALRGSILRQEVYALDDTDESDRPYSASERNYTIEVLQPQGPNRYAAFFSHPRETIDFHYERKLFQVVGNTLADPHTPPLNVREMADPRVTHALTLAVDTFGNVLQSVAVSYGRRYVDPTLTLADQTKQGTTLSTYTENTYTNAILEDDAYRAPLPAEASTFELIQVQPDGTRSDVTNLFRFSEIQTKVQAASDGQHDLLYEDLHATGLQAGQHYRRLIERVRALYRPDDLGTTAGDAKALLPLGVMESLALSGSSYKLAFTPGLLSQVYQRGQAALLPNPASVLGSVGVDTGGYVDLDGDGHWWLPSERMFYLPAVAAPQQERTQAFQHFFLPRRFEDPFGNSTSVDYDNPHDLLVVRTVDAVANTVAADNDYRVFQPSLITDPNGNRVAVAFDALGMVVGTAVMGKMTETLGDMLDASLEPDPTQAQLDAFMANPREASANADESVATQIVHDLLGKATTRIVYDLDRFKRLGEPPFAATLARETHVSELQQGQQDQQTSIQISFSYSDGFGREIQKKIQAEPGPVSEGGPLVNPRWVSSGWSIFNNKGKPVRQYEPFFDDTHEFKFGNQVGVSPILFYDPVERVVATLHPNHAWEKVVFDPWRQESWDVNDTVLIADPKADPDVGDFFRRLPDDDYLPSWYALRTDPSFAAEATRLWPDPKIRAAETDAATRTAAHANTPTIAFFDTLGRPFLTLAHNRFERNGAIVDEQYPTRVELDIEGNQREVRDAIVQDGDVSGRIVMRYDYDMLGKRIHQASMEAGERWMLGDVTGKPIRAWDSRGFLRRIAYDALRRTTETFVTEKGVERLDTRTVYGEGQGAANNYRTRVFQVFDGAGVVTSEAYDFKGNLLRGRRELLPNYQQAVDWQQNPVPNDGTFTSSTTYDALNRPTAVTAPDNSTYRPTYNEANLLDTVDVNLRGAQSATPFVTNINYNAKGQRELIVYGNGAQTRYDYDPLTFRLTRLRTTRPVGLNDIASQLFADPAIVQDLRYTFDPVGNITRIEDAALQTIFHSNEQVQPVCAYTYDALYRLIEAQGREHIGQTAHNFNPPHGNRRDFPFAGLADFIAHPNDMQAMRNYTERYEYDGVGNFQFMRHTANGGSWTRSYECGAASLIEPAKQSNRLTKTTVGNGLSFVETYTYTDAQGNDVHGCITAINNMKMAWDSKDQLQQVDLGGGGTAYYVYDGAGQRVRKVIEAQNGTRKQERLYLGSFEMYREYNGSGATVTLERETLHIMDDTQRIALVETKTQDLSQPPTPNPQPLLRYQFGNHLGSASLELDDQVQIISYEEYYPYGSTSFQAWRSAAEMSLKRYRYTGKERDEETGFTYHGARYYAAWLGRWVSCDPTGVKDGVDLYVYVGSNPTGLIDPTGTDGRTPNIAQMERRLKQIDEQIAKYEALLAAVERAKADLAELKAQQAKIYTQYVEASKQYARALAVKTEAAERAEKLRWENLSEGARNYEKMKKHTEWQVKSNPLLEMTGQIVEESQSQDVNIFLNLAHGYLAHSVTTAPEATPGIGASPKEGKKVSPFSGAGSRTPDCVRCVTSLIDAIENEGFVQPASKYPAWFKKGAAEFPTAKSALEYISEQTGVRFGTRLQGSRPGPPGDYVVFNAFKNGKPGHILWARVRPSGETSFYDPQIARKVSPGEVGPYEAYKIIPNPRAEP